ncbi:DUF3224 domain-containing protein [Nocardia camponoti]|uniref:DUF3224 domain-containing protein n=1 Tax=Nocardia camponoti TaxID=1616106 RepID=A0A917VA84_9NOCA|nr:DUF3224 domain-containing protein [Nocardia camponoti]GGK56072.1 hypothetical protein GCM10011591_30070 [Nocardia camponoti]
MKAIGTFALTAFDPTPVQPEPPIVTALPVGVSHMTKEYSGEIGGVSATLFTAAFDMDSGAGTYVAMESFDGTLNGVAGTFNFVHSATTGGTDRTHEFFLIVPQSGTGGLTGITGTGALYVDDKGGHHIWFDYELPA